MFNKFFNKRIGEYIVSRRESLDIRQYELAEKLGFTAQFLGKVESGKARIPVTALKKASKILKMDLDVIDREARRSSGEYLRSIIEG